MSSWVTALVLGCGNREERGRHVEAWLRIAESLLDVDLFAFAAVMEGLGSGFLGLSSDDSLDWSSVCLEARRQYASRLRPVAEALSTATDADADAPPVPHLQPLLRLLAQTPGAAAVPIGLPPTLWRSAAWTERWAGQTTCGWCWSGAEPGAWRRPSSSSASAASPPTRPPSPTSPTSPAQSSTLTLIPLL